MCCQYSYLTLCKSVPPSVHLHVTTKLMITATCCCNFLSRFSLLLTFDFKISRQPRNTHAHTWNARDLLQVSFFKTHPLTLLLPTLPLRLIILLFHSTLTFYLTSTLISLVHILHFTYYFLILFFHHFFLLHIFFFFLFLLLLSALSFVLSFFKILIFLLFLHFFFMAWKKWIYLWSYQIWVNSRADWLL